MFNNSIPIFVLLIFSKGLEKLIFKRLESFFVKHSVLTNLQFGFQRGESTESALLLQKEIILRNIERKLLILGVFIDFSKAFDRLNHKTLLAKLNKYGVRGTPFMLLKSHLYNRQQCVKIDGHHSSCSSNVCSIPQKSILGLL